MKKTKSKKVSLVKNGMSSEDKKLIKKQLKLLSKISIMFEAQANLISKSLSDLIRTNRKEIDKNDINAKIDMDFLKLIESLLMDLISEKIDKASKTKNTEKDNIYIELYLSLVRKIIENVR